MSVDSIKDNIFFHIQNYKEYKIYEPNLAKDVRPRVCTTPLLNIAHSQYPKIVSDIYVDFLDEFVYMTNLALNKIKDDISIAIKKDGYKYIREGLSKVLDREPYNDKEKNKIDQLRNQINDYITYCTKELNILEGNLNIETLKTKPTIKEVALYCYYTNNPITNQNCDHIVKDFGHNSGRSLYHDYLDIVSKTDRLASGETKVKHNNKLKVFEKVIDMLNQNDFDSTIAQSEYEILKIKSEKF